MIPDLIVRADAGPDVGLGHMVRSMGLAQAWQDAGGAVILATTTGRADMPTSIETESAGIVPIVARHPNPADIAVVANLVVSRPGAWVLCDGYHFDATYTSRLRKAGARVLLIDDRADQSMYHSDVLLNQNPGAERLAYCFDVKPLCLFGPRFALLPRAFARWRGRSAVIPNEPVCLLVTVGGSDADHANFTIARAVARFLRKHPMRAIVLAGLGANAAAWTEAARAADCRSLEIVSNPPDVSTLMAAADLAVSAAGSTALQLCFMGVPAVLTMIADNQAGVASGLDEAGCAVNLGRQASLGESELSDALERLFVDRGVREGLSKCGQDLVDGMGAERVAAALLRYPEDADEAV